jgi:hypothetical protein
MYYNFFIKLYDFKSRIKMAKVDFDKPWWEIIWKQKCIMGWLLLSLGIVKEPRSKERGIVKLQIPQISLVSQFCGFACSLN